MDSSLPALQTARQEGHGQVPNTSEKMQLNVNSVPCGWFIVEELYKHS